MSKTSTFNVTQRAGALDCRYSARAPELLLNDAGYEHDNPTFLVNETCATNEASIEPEIVAENAERRSIIIQPKSSHKAAQLNLSLKIPESVHGRYTRLPVDE
jgi:hypothetical protein